MTMMEERTKRTASAPGPSGRKTMLCGLLVVLAGLLLHVPDAGAARRRSGAKRGTLIRKECVAGYANPNAWYHFWIPPSYRRTRKMPLYIFLHGGHVGAGTADNIVDIHKVVPKLKESLVLFPNHLYWFWSHPDESVYVMTIMDEILRKYAVDRKRIYVLGSSMGGNGAMHLAARFPEMFAACAPISCWCQFVPVEKAGVMPIYCTHGTKDKVVPIKWARDIKKRLQKVEGLRLEYHELDYGHQAPMDVFVKATEWMSQFSNPRTFRMADMRKRAASLPLQGWMKRKEYQAGYHNALAWGLLTCEDKKLRDPAEALKLAKKANGMTGHKNPGFLDTLALAYFENKRTKEAIETQRKAISLLPKRASADMRKEMEKRLKQFEATRR